MHKVVFSITPCHRVCGGYILKGLIVPKWPQFYTLSRLLHGYLPTWKKNSTQCVFLPLKVFQQRNEASVYLCAPITSPQLRSPDVSPATMASGVPLSIITPLRTPGASTGVPSVPPAAAASPQLRNQILAGTVNLVKNRLCSADSSGRHLVDCGDVSVILKRVTPDRQKPNYGRV